MVIAWLAVKGHPESTRHVEGREDRGDDPDRIKQKVAVDESRAENLVLRPEARERRERREGAACDQHRPEGHRRLPRQPTHLAHVLLTAEPVDHRAGPEGKERLEEGT